MSGRKSSIGGARLQKSHVPYRGDDPTVGRKTGISVAPVPRGSDGFEPFEELIGQIHDSGRPRKRVRRSSERGDGEDEEEDEDGEMSMDVDSPIQNYSNTRPPNTPRSARRPIARTSEVDFDEVPSPRSPRSARRGAGPSRLAALNDKYDDDDDDGAGGFNDGDGMDDYDNGGAPGDSPRQMSFTEMDNSRDDEEDDNPTPKKPSPKKPSPKKGKGKARAATPLPEPDDDENSGMEDDIARGMEDDDMDPQNDEDEDEDEVVQPPPAKKGKQKEASKPVRTAPPSKRQKENREVPPGTRRSARTPYAPLEWWRNEKVEFGGRDPEGGPILVPRIKAIVRIPKEPVVPLGKHARGVRKRSRTPATADKGKPRVVEKIIEVPVAAENPEEGWDDETETQAVVKAFEGGGDVKRRIAFTARMVDPAPAANNEWFFHKIFGDGDFIAAGQIIIPPGGRKPSKQSRDNTFIFLVMEGAVNLKVYDTSLIIASGGMFMIPRGNTYFIENIAERDAKLFFTQARKVKEGENEKNDGDGDGDGGGEGDASIRSEQNGRAMSLGVGVGGGKEKAVPRRGMSAAG
ncbi:Mif2/CENP-C like-domain-containing protein [Mycena albidolilacea]|uniref:CENP-C homolog n=1 Tax=Mycena albidolilacea TaxID=1033008 RepID=A0AAD7ADL2_9AGAR|nr:Mif2/CENP-C like-domain-containing protein [Mycena albidolilacea]